MAWLRAVVDCWRDVRAASGRLDKRARMARLFATLEEDDLKRAANWLSGDLGREPPGVGWALVRRTPLPETLNRTRDVQDALLASLPPGPRPARRSAVEIVYDTLLWHRARGERLLANAWDWSRSGSTDAGWAAVGDFAPSGLRVIAYSAAVRFGTLGVCVQR